MSENVLSSAVYKVISTDSASYFEGKLLTLIETLGLRDSQEQAVKSVFRNEFWNWYHDKSWHADISDDEASELFKKVK